MKKLLLLVSAVTLAVVLSACAPKTYEIALVTDVGKIDDGSFNQGAWEGVVQFAEENDISHTYYEPAEKSTDAYVDAIELAIETGATTVVCPGYLFEQAVWTVQGDYPDVNFILLDGSPNNVTNWDDASTEDVDETTTLSGDGAANMDFTVEDNVRPIFYSEEQSGFLAGYAAVKEGFTNLGFVGGMPVPAVVRFGYGYVQGANQAAVDMDLADGAITINYWYSNVFWETPDVSSTAVAWFQGGTEVIFAAAGGAGTAVMTAAEQEGGKTIGVDIDQRDASETVITSAKKELAVSVYDTLVEIYDGNFTGGEAVVFTAENDGIGLPDNFDRFDVFTATDYAAIYAKLVDGTIEVNGDNTKTLAEIQAMVPKVTIVE